MNTRTINQFILTGFLASSLLLSGCAQLDPVLAMLPKEVKAMIPGLKDQTHATAEEETASEGGGASEAISPEELELAMLPPAMRDLPYEEIYIPGPERIYIYGRLYDPSQMEEESDSPAPPPPPPPAGTEEEVEDPKYPLVILIPGMHHTRTVWDVLPAKLVKAGYAVFVMDIRGHGKSTRTASRKRFSWRLFKADEWQKIPRDLNAVVHFFQKTEDYPQVDNARIALVGEKISANAAIVTGEKKKKVVKALVLLSPGLDYKGITPSQAAITYPGAVLVMVSDNDSYSMESSPVLYRIFGGQKLMRVYKKTGSGTDMLSPAVQDEMVNWFKKALPVEVTAPTPATTTTAENTTSKPAGH